jgi:FkbM family methyltransferase
MSMSMARLVHRFRPLAKYLPKPVKDRLVSIYLAGERKRWAAASGLAALESQPMPDGIDVVISPNEISFAHGTGVLLSRLMDGADKVIAMRSRTDYGGEQRLKPLRAHVLPAGVTDRQDIFGLVHQWLDGAKVRSILCAPYFETDLTIAMAAQAITGAPLGLWIMDDNCLKANGIRREVMAEAIGRADALFAISPELKRAYQTEFRKAMAVLPPLVAESLVSTMPSAAKPDGRLLMIGNLWSPDILDRFSALVQEAGLEIEWHASNPELWSSRISADTLKARGITVVDSGDPKVLAAAVSEAKAVIVPSDPGDSGDHEAAIGAMSLPTRMPFVLATSGTPLVVVSQPGTAAAAFVRHFEAGRTVAYDAAAFADAIRELGDATEQTTIRARAAAVAQRFSVAGAREFVFETIRNGGRWPDDRFESLLPYAGASYGIFMDRPLNPHFERDFGEVLSLCDRMKAAGFTPDFIMDVGASTGIWSLAVSTVYATPRYILCDPMFSRYGKLWTKPEFELIEAAISDKPGEATFAVSSDLYGSSLINVSGVVSVVDSVTVPVMTIDQIAKDKGLTGRGLVKVDVQYAEHLVIDGGRETLMAMADVVVLELTLARAHAKARTLLEIANQMDGLGFRIFDQTGGWRVPGSGELEQLDLAFVRKGAAFAIGEVEAVEA